MLMQISSAFLPDNTRDKPMQLLLWIAPELAHIAKSIRQLNILETIASLKGQGIEWECTHMGCFYRYLVS